MLACSTTGSVDHVDGNGKRVWLRTALDWCNEVGNCLTDPNRSWIISVNMHHVLKYVLRSILDIDKTWGCILRNVFIYKEG